MSIENIQMVDLKTQYLHIKDAVDTAVLSCIASTAFINGPAVKAFQSELEAYLGVKHVIPCANGTDALQIAMMALGLQPGDEVIVPSFTYVATAEVIALLGLTPVMIDVCPETFNITAALVAPAITERTRAIVPVHLFGQAADMEGIMALAKAHNLYVIEDNAQAIGADYTFSDGTIAKTGAIGHVGCTSFFPSKNLGCYGDGGAIFTNDDALAAKLRMVANHGQSVQYYHDVVGVNSRLDSIQAAILSIKLAKLDEYSAARQQLAAAYDAAFAEIPALVTPKRNPQSTHVFHQYTLQVKNGERDSLKAFLQTKKIPAMIYYPVALYDQKAFGVSQKPNHPVTEDLCSTVLSLPMHTEMTEEVLAYIVSWVTRYFEIRD
jgi:UDP-2-acetamido-2-deoxy-ribo-hexuluronate aminotransferase